MGEEKLTDEQAEFLALCEEEFKDRYTDEDKDFMKIKCKEYRKPPIVDPWYNKPRRPNYDWSRQNRDQGGRRGHNSDRRNNDRGYNKYDRHTNRHSQRNGGPY